LSRKARELINYNCEARASVIIHITGVLASIIINLQEIAEKDPTLLFQKDRTGLRRLQKKRHLESHQKDQHGISQLTPLFVRHYYY
jgi:hypothetical protein